MKLLEYLLDDRNVSTRWADRKHDNRLDALEAENEHLRALVHRHHEVLKVIVRALAAKGIAPELGETEQAAERVVTVGASPSTAVKFACATCGSLLPTTELRRVGEKFFCETCNVDPDPGPVDEGSYR